MRKTLFILVLFVNSGIACGSADSVLRVNLDSSDATTVTQLASQISVGTEFRTKDIQSPDGQPISLSAGTSFTLEIPHQYSGAVQVFVAGLDANSTVLLNGAGSLDALNVGHLNDLEVAWQPSP
jgi:hypothetical protein